jgi:hypothetical protein
MPAPPDTPHEQALRNYLLLNAFVEAPFPPPPESPAPLWLLTPEGRAYMQAWSSGDLDRAGQIFDAASTRVFQDLWETWCAQHPHAREEHTHG